MTIKSSGHFFYAAAGLTIGFNQGFSHMRPIGRKISKPIFHFGFSVSWTDTGRSRLSDYYNWIKKCPRVKYLNSGAYCYLYRITLGFTIERFSQLGHFVYRLPNQWNGLCKIHRQWFLMTNQYLHLGHWKCKILIVIISSRSPPHRVMRRGGRT